MNTTIIFAFIVGIAIITGCILFVVLVGIAQEPNTAATKPIRNRRARIAVSVIVGAALGVVFGTAVDNMGLGIGCGVAIGVAVGAAIESRRPKGA